MIKKNQRYRFGKKNQNFSKNQTYDKIEINCNTEITPQIEEYMSFELEKLSSKNEYADVTSSYKLRNEKEQQQRIWLEKS